MREHEPSTNKPHGCTLCKTFYVTEGALSQHLKMHEDETMAADGRKGKIKAKGECILI